jgi:hypothetical protein
MSSYNTDLYEAVRRRRGNIHGLLKAVIRCGGVAIAQVHGRAIQMLSPCPATHESRSASSMLVAVLTAWTATHLKGPYLALDSSSEAFIGRRPPSNTITGTTPQPRSRRMRSMQKATYLSQQRYFRYDMMVESKSP